MPGGLVQRDRNALLAWLEQVDVEGWDGPAGRELLVEVRHTVVLPLIAQIGLRGVAAEQAVATGWAVAWEVLRSPSTRSARSPRGVVWVAVRRAILNEHVAAMYATTPREAWRQAARDDAASGRPVSLDALVGTGCEPVAQGSMQSWAIIPLMVELMAEVGWDRAEAQDVMEAVAQAAPWGPASGWRWIANRVDAEAWQVRRLIDILLGAGGGPSAVALIERPGDETLQSEFRRRLLWTLHKRRPLEQAG